jgi:hypothetical protein
MFVHQLPILPANAVCFATKTENHPSDRNPSEARSLPIHSQGARMVCWSLAGLRNLERIARDVGSGRESELAPVRNAQ